MFYIKKISFTFFTVLYTISLLTLILNADVEIKGTIGIIEKNSDYKEAWKKYTQNFSINIEDSQDIEYYTDIDTDKEFKFSGIDSNEDIRMYWKTTPHTGQYILYPFDIKKSATSFSNSVVNLQFRKIDWLLLRFKEKRKTAVEKNDIVKLDNIIKNAKKYHKIFHDTNNPEIIKIIDKYKYQFILEICQIAGKKRLLRVESFITPKNLKIQKYWYLTLIELSAKLSKETKDFKYLTQSLNLWIRYVKDAYMQYHKLPDRNIIFSSDNNQLDSEFINQNISLSLSGDIELIASVLENTSLRPNHFQDINAINLNKISQWIRKKNREYSKH